MPDTPLDDAEVHVLDAHSARRGRGAWLVGLVAVLVLAGAGAWVALTDPFAERAAVAVATPDPSNELGEAWSFETTEAGRATSFWTVPDDAPGGFAFVESAATSGQLGAQVTSPAGYAEMVSSAAVSLGMHKGGVRLACAAGGEGVQLFARFETGGRAPIDFFAAQGSGALEGIVPLPPGAESVRAGVRATGSATIDDVVLELVASTVAQPESRGVYSALSHGGTLVVARGSEPALFIMPPSVRLADGRTLPAGVGFDPAAGRLTIADGSAVPVETKLAWDGPQARVTTTWGAALDGATAVRVGRVVGPLADDAIGVSSVSAGFQRFDDDFSVSDAAWLTLGRTQDRLVLRVDEGVALTSSRRADGSIELRVEAPLVAGERLLTLQTSFTEERVRAVARRDAARRARQDGDLGAALAEVETILRDDPYDEDVLREAGQMRSELLAQMQQRLDAIDENLDDALFLASARRCREVLAECEAAAATFAGSSAEQRFAERADVVRTRAFELLEADRQRRAARLEAIAASLEEFGNFERLASEYRDTLDRWLAPTEGGSR